MAYQFAAATPNVFSLSPFAAEFVTLTPAAADYVAGGYTPTPGTGIAMGKILFAIPVGGQGGWIPVWNPTTGKIQMFTASATPGPAVALSEVTAGTDLSAQVFEFLLIGY
jgi:hypothetical protein